MHTVHTVAAVMLSKQTNTSKLLPNEEGKDKFLKQMRLEIVFGRDKFCFLEKVNFTRK